MINFCKHTLQSFLSKKVDDSHPRNPVPILPSMSSGLCLIASNFEKSSTIVESTTVKFTEKKDTAGEIGGASSGGGSGGSGGGVAVDGLSSCTESLGFESSDQMEEMMGDETTKARSRSTVGLSVRKESRERSRWRERVKKLPPPLSSLNSNGQSNFFLKSVRQNGRLVMTEVSIDRPEIFVTSRENGRLRLDLVKSEDDIIEEIQDEEEEEQVEVEEVKKDEVIEEEMEGSEQTEWKVEQVETDEVIEQEMQGSAQTEWIIPFAHRGGDGFRRCHELNHHHHSHMPVWNHHHQQCVTTR